MIDYKTEHRASVVGPTHFPHHRSGWGYAMDALNPVLRARGVVFDTFIESTFCWQLEQNRSSGFLPYTGNWVGFVHNPPGIPVWHEYHSAPQVIFQQPLWRESLRTCRGLFTFSETMANWMRERVPVPVAALIHPTEFTDQMFDIQHFLAQDTPRIVQVGAWLRRVNSIALLPVRRLRRTCLIPSENGELQLWNLIARERENEPAALNADWSTVDILQRLKPADFDALLSRNIVFLDLYDSTVNNTVIECIVRATPIVCNRLPALVEMLGPNYPLFFTSLDEAAAKAEDMKLIEETAAYLRALPKEVFTGEYFAGSVTSSELYRSLLD